MYLVLMLSHINEKLKKKNHKDNNKCKKVGRVDNGYQNTDGQ